MMDHAARSLGLSPRTFTRRFRESTGLNFRQWRMQARLKRSIEALQESRSVALAAYEAGYESVSAFTSAFRSVFGETPSKNLPERVVRAWAWRKHTRKFRRALNNGTRPNIRSSA